jgi:hypothetical protein
MAETAAATGISKKEQIDSLKEQQEDSTFRFRQLRAMREKDESYLQYATQVQRQLSDQFGGEKDAFLRKAISSAFGQGGQMDDESLAILAQYMPEFTQKVQELGARFDVGNAEERKRVTEELKGLRSLYIDELKTGAASDYGTTKNIGNAAIRDKLINTTAGQEAIAGNYLKSTGQDKNPLERRQTAQAELYGVATEDGFGLKAGDREAGSETTKLVVNLQQRLKDLSTYSNEFLMKLNTELGQGVSTIRTMNMQPVLNNGAQFLKIFGERFNGTDFTKMQPEDAKNHIMNLLEGLMNEVSAKKVEPAKKAGGGSVDSGFTLVGELGPELLKMSGPGDMLTALDTKNMASDMKNGMSTVLPMLNILREIPQIISNAVDTTADTTTTSTTQVGQEDSTEYLKQISNKMEQFILVASQIASHSEKTARNTDDLGDNVYS